jgi:hypothetical protein
VVVDPTLKSIAFVRASDFRGSRASHRAHRVADRLLRRVRGALGRCRGARLHRHGTVRGRRSAGAGTRGRRRQEPPARAQHLRSLFRRLAAARVHRYERRPNISITIARGTSLTRSAVRLTGAGTPSSRPSKLSSSTARVRPAQQRQIASPDVQLDRIDGADKRRRLRLRIFGVQHLVDSGNDHDGVRMSIRD